VGLEKAEWDALSALAEAGSGAAHGPIYPSPADGTAEVAKEADFNKDFSELYENFIEMGTGSSSWMAMCSIAAGKTGAGDLNVALAQAEEAFNTPNGTNLQKSIIILTAMGVDVTAVEFEEGSPVNLLEKLAKNPTAIGAWAESPAYSLLAFGANPDYGVDRSFVNNPDKLIENLAGYQVPDGTFGWNGQTGSPDSTGAALAALSCYMDNEQTAEMIAEALEGLKAYQNDDGGFGWEAGAETSVDSTAQVIIGLCAMGIDPTSEEWTKGENNPITALLGFANDDNSDLAEVAGLDMNICREDAFRAMAAFAGLRNTGAAYNVYTRAIEGNAQFDYEVKYELNEHQLDIPVGSTAKLEYKGNDGSAAEGAVWTSSDPAIVEVLEDGTVNALMIGKAKITVTTADEKQSDSCDINVLFKDVTDKSLFYYDYIYALVDAGIIAGYNDGTFRPMNECNRAAVVTFLWRSADKPEPANMASFSDMTGNEEFDKAISWAVEQGITNGWTDNTFRPWRTCNRAAVLTFLWRMAKEPEPTKMAEFSDMTGNEEFDKAISWAVEQGIATGWTDNTFRPWIRLRRDPPPALGEVFAAAFPVAVGAYARQGLVTCEHLAI
ncbi:MAG: S-layer homology domain-containing protein, partial [Lachnospiraceae bacterium]|nr:S-layer homology domain-containing protein [Lachnospiraceae bacterium]